jgi:hypothetical protein
MRGHSGLRVRQRQGSQMRQQAATLGRMLVTDLASDRQRPGTEAGPDAPGQGGRSGGVPCEENEGSCPAFLRG